MHVSPSKTVLALGALAAVLFSLVFGFVPREGLADNRRPDVVGTQSGCKVVADLGTSWVAYTSASLQNEAKAIGTTVSSGMLWSEAFVRNDEAAGGSTIYIDTYAAGAAGDAVTNRRTLPPGAAFEVPTYGERPSTIRLRGSAINTDLLLCGKLVPAGN